MLLRAFDTLFRMFKGFKGNLQLDTFRKIMVYRKALLLEEVKRSDL
jgi:hypothetical protein